MSQRGLGGRREAIGYVVQFSWLSRRPRGALVPPLACILYPPLTMTREGLFLPHLSEPGGIPPGPPRLGRFDVVVVGEWGPFSTVRPAGPDPLLS